MKTFMLPALSWEALTIILQKCSKKIRFQHYLRGNNRVLQYSQRAKDYMVTYRRSNQVEIVEYIDYDFVGCQYSMKSTSGYIYLLFGGTISWKSVKQFLIASYTMAAEFIKYYEASNYEIWLQNFVTGQRIVDSVDRPLKLFCDNKSAVLYSNNNRSSTKSKYIDTNFLVVKERV